MVEWWLFLLLAQSELLKIFRLISFPGCIFWIMLTLGTPEYWRSNLAPKRYLYIYLSVWKCLSDRLLIYLLRFNIENAISGLVPIVTQFASFMSIWNWVISLLDVWSLFFWSFIAPIGIDKGLEYLVRLYLSNIQST